MRRPFVVMRARGPAWDDSKNLDGQAEWPAHADFMDALAAERFVLLAGPLEGTRDAMLVILAEDCDEIETRLAADPWTKNGLLVTRDCRPWVIRLGSLG